MNLADKSISAPEPMAKLFHYKSFSQVADLNALDTSNVTSLYETFNGGSSLTANTEKGLLQKPTSLQRQQQTF